MRHFVHHVVLHYSTCNRPWFSTSLSHRQGLTGLLPFRLTQRPCRSDAGMSTLCGFYPQINIFNIPVVGSEFRPWPSLRNSFWFFYYPRIPRGKALDLTFFSIIPRFPWPSFIFEMNLSFFSLVLRAPRGYSF